MISPLGDDPLPRSQAQQSDELTAILQGHTSDERLSGSAYWSAAVAQGNGTERGAGASLGLISHSRTRPAARPGRPRFADVSDQRRGKSELKTIGGPERGHCERILITFSDQGAHAFFGNRSSTPQTCSGDCDGRLRRHGRALTDPWKRRSAGACGPRN
jgi:hypothetical protein